MCMKAKDKDNAEIIQNAFVDEVGLLLKGE